jgi:hypothetical protein
MCAVNANGGGKTSDKFDYAIKVCTEGIERFKKQEAVTDFYYYRGLARYLRVRQVTFDESQSRKFKPFSEFLPKFSATASEADYELAYDAASDLMTGLALSSAAEKYKSGHLYEAEMLALLALKKPSDASRFKDDHQSYAAKALEEFAKAEKTVADKTIVVGARQAFEAEHNKMNSASGAQARYKQYSLEIDTNSDAYTKSVKNFQTVLQAQQTSATPSVAPVCQAISEMNANFQKVNLSLAKIIGMKNKGELGFLPAETLKQISDDEARDPSRQAQINGAAEHFGCKMNR